MGLGTQMVAWHTDFCEDLARRGFFVIRFDNRDVGRSTRLDGAHVPSWPSSRCGGSRTRPTSWPTWRSTRSG